MRQPLVTAHRPLPAGRVLPNNSRTRLGGAAALGIALLLGGCSGASSSAEAVGSAEGPFELVSVSVEPGQNWQINRPIEFNFSAPVDFDTVNFNTISIQETSGAPAVGDFIPGDDSRTILFQPVCPTRSDFSDAGFRPGGITYRIVVPTTQTGSQTLVSAAGNALISSFPSHFQTPTDTASLPLLFLDPVPGGVRAISGTGAPGEVATSIRFGDEETGTEYPFVVNGTTGLGELPVGTLVPINYYSDVASQVVVNLRLNQAVSPTAQNISTERIKLQYQTTSVPAVWKDLSVVLNLKANCAGTGAWIEIKPVGVLPQNRALRVVVSQEFEDLVGELNPGPQDNFATMFTRQAEDLSATPIPTGDVFTEEYMNDGFEDTIASLTYPRANWGADGLEAAFAFDGTGGPNGEFDVRITTDKVFNTVSQTFTGGPGGLNQGTILAVNGRLDVRDLIIDEGATLRITGPNPARILCSGKVVINGTLQVNGGNAKSVFTLNTPNQAETGAPGQGGGGEGGDGSYLTTQVTPIGGHGKGAYNSPNGGGRGGEAGWSTDEVGNAPRRRAAGGGGGRLGHRQLLRYTNGSGQDYFCADYDRTGLDYESGFPGAPTCNSSQDGGSHLPYGGRSGPSPFTLTPNDVTDDFLGSKVADIGTPNERLVRGELVAIQPGAGGGAGGDSTRSPSNSYPPSELINNHQDKGAGGGGGAGALTIYALGNVIFGPDGVIQAVGGHGNGGENTYFVNRVGGGSGGGSGGHIVIHTAGKIDFSQVTPNVESPVLDAKGGQGGEGARGCGVEHGCGGAFTGEISAADDGVHATNEAALPAATAALSAVENPWIYSASDDEYIPTDCAIGAGLPNDIDHYQGIGGDGGPGLIQLHVGRLYDDGPETSDIIYPTGGGEEDLRFLSSPVPHGYDVNDREWNDHLLPAFGRFSTSQSDWIPLGESSVDPSSSTPQPITFLFDGTNASGFVESTADMVDPLTMILTDPTVDFDTTIPSIPKVLLPAGGLDPEYAIAKGNASFFKDFVLEVSGFGTMRVANATYEEPTDTFVVEVVDPPLGLTTATGAVTLYPRQFSVETEGVSNYLPDGQAIQLEFDLRYEVAGNPILQETGFVSDLAGTADTLNMGPNTIRFVRYRVTFDIGTGDLNFTTPLPGLDFLKIPFRF